MLFPCLLLGERSSLPKGWEGEGVGFEHEKEKIKKIGVGTTTTPIKKKECKCANKRGTLENKGIEGN